jgi:hypothetical protein
MDHVCRFIRSALPDWNENVLVVRLFTRLLGLIFLAAFVSLGVQIEGLVGQAGIRLVIDRHHFTSPEERRQTRQLWRPERIETD